jgi:hypothetical protein
MDVMYVCVCIYTHTHTHTHTIHTHTHNTHTHTHTHTHVYIMYVCVYVCVRVYVRASVFTHAYTHTHRREFRVFRTDHGLISGGSVVLTTTLSVYSAGQNSFSSKSGTEDTDAKIRTTAAAATYKLKKNYVYEYTCISHMRIILYIYI